MKNLSYFALFYFLGIYKLFAQSLIFAGGQGAGSGNFCFQEQVATGTQLFNGGKEDGFSFSCHQQIPAIGLPIFNGGIEDGFANNCFLQGVTPVYYGAFGGGPEDGFSVYCYQQPAIAGAALFNGGNNNNQNFVLCYEQALSSSTLFFGGNSNAVSGITCYQQLDYILPSYFYGGTDMFASVVKCFEQPSETPSYFYGGKDDGFFSSCYQQMPASGQTIFNGGIEDGFASNCFLQGVVPTYYGAFGGGIEDGFAAYCYQQPMAAGMFLFNGGNNSGSQNFILCYEQNSSTSVLFYGGKSNNTNSITCYKQPDYLITLILPVELLSFKAELTDSLQAKISWQTAAEKNNNYFIVQRSTDTYKWEDIAKIAAKGNNSTSINNYQIYDARPLEGISYYRLKQVDKDGVAAYSLIESINFNKKEINDLQAEAEFLVYPNPTNYLINFQFTNFKADDLDVYIIDMFGKIVYKKSITLTDGTGLYGFEKLDSMQPGTYIISVFQKNERLANKRLIIQ